MARGWNRKTKNKKETQHNVVIKNKVSRTRKFPSLSWTIDYYVSLVRFFSLVEPQFSRFKIKTVRLLTTRFMVKDASYTAYCHCYYYYHHRDDFIVIKNQEGCEWHAIFWIWIQPATILIIPIWHLYWCHCIAQVLKNKDLALKPNSITY